MDIREKMLPVLQPKGGKEEINALREVIESGWWGKGPKVEEFEEKFAKMVGHKYAIAVTSNSHGQDLIMKAMGFKGIDVINPAISFIATAMIPLWNNCTSNIVDVKADTLCIDPIDVEKYKKNKEKNNINRPTWASFINIIKNIPIKIKLSSIKLTKFSRTIMYSETIPRFLIISDLSFFK